MKPEKDIKDEIKAIYRAEMKEAFLDTLKFVPFYLLSVIFVSFLGTFLVKSEEFIQYGNFFNSLFMVVVFLGKSRKRRDKFNKQILAVLKK